jgi:hypothetical protein
MDAGDTGVLGVSAVFAFFFGFSTLFDYLHPFCF